MDETNGNSATPMEEEPVDEFGRPLRPNVDSSDSDSDKEYNDRYNRKGRESRDREPRESFNSGGGGGGYHQQQQQQQQQHHQYHHPGSTQHYSHHKYSPERRSSRRDHSPTGNGGVGGVIGNNIIPPSGLDRRNRRSRSPSPNQHIGYRGRPSSSSSSIRRDPDWNNPDFRNGSRSSSSSNIINSNSSSNRSNTPHDIVMGEKPKRIQKRGDLFFDSTLKTYKQFLDYQDDSITSQEADKKYEEYKTEFAKRQSRIFFKEHQSEEWFKEKYDPTFLRKKRTEKLEKTPSLVESFKSILNDQNHKFSLNTKDNIKAGDKLDLDIHINQDTDHDHNEDDDKMQEDKEKPTTTLTATTTTTPQKENTTLFIKTVSPTCTKDELLEVLNKVGPSSEPSVTKLILSEPVRYKNFNRLGWVTFKSVELSQKALKELNGYKMRDFDLYLNINKPSDDAERRFKTTPSIASTEARLNIDLTQAITLAELFDQDKNILENPLFSCESWSTLSTVEKLDRVIHYLRYVHFFCYYCCDEFCDEIELDRKCGTIHLRKPVEVDSLNSNGNNSNNKESNGVTNSNISENNNNNNQENNDENNKDDSKKDENEMKTDDDKKPSTEEQKETTNQDENGNNGDDEKKESSTNTTTTTTEQQKDEIEKPKLSFEAENTWVTNLDNNIKNKINKINNEEQYTCTEMIQKASEEFISNNTIKLEEEKFKCAICDKLFKGAEYVKKHINLKHPEELKKASMEEGLEEQFFINYYSDPKRITPNLVQNQLLQQQGVVGMAGPPGMYGPYGYGPNGMMGGMPTTRGGIPTRGWSPAPGMIPTMMMGGPPIYGHHHHSGMIPMSPVFANGSSPVSPGGSNRIGGGSRSGSGSSSSNGVVSGPRGRGFGNGMTSPNRNFPPQGGMIPGGGDPRYRPYPTPQRPPVGMNADPRGIREYVDLDAPLDTVPDIDYRSALKEYQNKRNS